jgi:hypothetical protein
MTQRLACTRCGDSIHPDTAKANAGLCMPCKGGYRERIEEGKRQRVKDREYAASPEARYWRDLVSRASPNASALAGPERTYFAVSCLIGEVYNGGFDQFFSNTSGELYREALEGLEQMQATESVSLLRRAKAVLFGAAEVPFAREARMALMPTFGADESAPEWSQLEVLDNAFWKDPDKLGERCATYAKEHHLYDAG